MTESNIKDIKQKLLGQKKKKSNAFNSSYSIFNMAFIWNQKKKKEGKGKRSKNSVLRRLLIREQLYDVLVNVCFWAF